MNIHTRGEENVHTIFKNLIAHSGSDFLDKGCVPGTGQQSSDRESRGIESTVVSLTGGADPKAGGTVSKNCHRYS